MKVVDQNQWLTPPEGYTLISVGVDGAYIKLTYENWLAGTVKSTVVVYLNSDGREVLRSVDQLNILVGADDINARIPPPRRKWYERIWRLYW